VALTFEGDRLEAVVVRRTNGSVELRQSMTGTLSLDSLTNDPQLVGREIRKLLDGAGIRERRCAVCLPATWALALQVRLPELPPEDLESFVQLEAERGFPYSPENLVLTDSRFRTPNGESYATLIAVPREHVRRLQATLSAAQLVPQTFSLGITALRPPVADPAEGVLVVVPGVQGVGILVAMGNAVLMLRVLESAYETIGASQQLQADSLLRELRITLGQLPTDVRSSLRRIVVVGGSEAAVELFEELQQRTASWNLRVEQVREYGAGDLPLGVPAGTLVAPGVSLAVRHLAGRKTDFEFLPPRVTAWERLTAQYASKKLVGSSVAAGVLAALVALAFGIQQIRLNHWQGEWNSMATKVTELDAIQQQIRRYRPWFDESIRSLSVLRSLTRAFPEDGAVSAKSVELRGETAVICSGTARDQASLMATLDRLQTTPEFANVRLEQSSGQSPVEFTLNFQWAGGGGR
jgi:hypothetical protein